MTSSAPFDLAREFAIGAPRRNQLWAIGGTADATSTVFSALDWMTAIIWPIEYEDSFRLENGLAPRRVEEQADLLENISVNYPLVDTVPMASPPAERVVAVATWLRLSLQRILGFEARVFSVMQT